jgi:hypothetical protein
MDTQAEHTLEGTYIMNLLCSHVHIGRVIRCRAPEVIYSQTGVRRPYLALEGRLVDQLVVLNFRSHN